MITSNYSNITEMNNSYLEENGYWYSEHSGIWYQKFYRDSAKMYYGWEKVENKEAVEILTIGLLPHDLQAFADYQHDLESDLNN